MNYTEANQQIVVMSFLLVLLLVLIFVAIFFWQRWLNRKMTSLGLAARDRLKKRKNKN